MDLVERHVRLDWRDEGAVGLGPAKGRRAAIPEVVQAGRGAAVRGWNRDIFDRVVGPGDEVVLDRDPASVLPDTCIGGVVVLERWVKRRQVRELLVPGPGRVELG